VLQSYQRHREILLGQLAVGRGRKPPVLFGQPE
jgi:hypothetical protein